ncbi:hypothetical protein N7505_007731 [Penicillium chrysogenum]|uniref:chitinase n=1 Tax=Penicillium chrysogenum TaxID=5076 RepID=A0ABQ8WEX0_PENCH|nr:hypothetical protein N7505_007731 [Penicillium chrysogenum]
MLPPAPPLTVNNGPDIVTRDAHGYRSVAYFVNWGIYGRNFQPQNIPAERLTHILYAFANTQGSGEVVMSDSWSDTDKHYSTDSWADTGNNVYGCVKQLFSLKKKNRKLKVLLSIGGWQYSKNLKIALQTEAGRQKFADSAVELLQNLGFDGIDVDYEYPANDTEADELVDTLRRLREVLDSYSSANAGDYHFLLTAASPAGSSHYQNEHLDQMDQYLDFWNLMAYDYSGCWDSTGGCQAPPVNTDQAIEYYTSHGVASSKIVLGMPLYGRAFTDTSGPGQISNGVGAGSWEDGVWDYKALPPSGCSVRDLDQEAASYCYNSASRLFISYDTPENAHRKAEYIMSKGLGGGMWWELSGDKQGRHSLVTTVVDTFGGIGALDQSDNQLSYPISTYDNINS